ncbi:MAG: NUDIX hydrolase [Cumulibacter sp.]
MSTQSTNDTPVVRQRIGAYGVLTREINGRRELLLTRISPTDYGAGMWTLPGGGIDHGEHPDDAVVREVYEETSLSVRVRSVVTVTSLHVIGKNRAGVLEDFQGVGIIYLVDADSDADLDSLRVVEENSSTDLVEWVPLDLLTERELTNVARAGLTVAAV